LLVRKGIITEEELLDAFDEEVQRFEGKIEDKSEKQENKEE